MDKKTEGLVFNPYIFALINILGLGIHVWMWTTTASWDLAMINKHGMIFSILFGYNLAWFYFMHWKK